MTDPRFPFRSDDDDRLRLHLRRAGTAISAGDDAPALLEARVALGVRRARAWLDARIAGAAPPESLLSRPLRAREEPDAAPHPGDARAREIAWKLRRALKE